MYCFKTITKHGALIGHQMVNRRIPDFLKKFQLQYCCTKFNELFKLNEEKDFYDKIIYNEILINTKVKKTLDTSPIFLKYLNNSVEKSTTALENKTEENEIVHFPYEPEENFILLDDNLTDLTPTEVEPVQGEWKEKKLRIDFKNLENPNEWMQNIEPEDNTPSYVKFQFGTCDPNVPVSFVPCGGCGAMLHCRNASVPGFIPREVFTEKSKEELFGEICQRCHFLKKFNVALGVNISASTYEKIIQSLRTKTALVILMIDLLDFPCSIFPEITNIIGPDKPVIIVGNKVDLFIQEGPECLKHLKNSLIAGLKQHQMYTKNIKYITLISAKTGYGIEDLITKLQRSWGYQGDVYLLGCTNVGKSTLFNTLIQSDYCGIRAVDLLQRATISPWPGTTLNLLKFPILRPTTARLLARDGRLRHFLKEKKAQDTLFGIEQKIHLHQIPLHDYIGRTFTDPSAKHDDHILHPFVKKDSNEDKRVGFNPRSADFVTAKWCYDTPGVITHNQIVNFLTTNELLLTMPDQMLIPRNFHMKPESSLFIGGLARLDYVFGGDLVWFTVFASMKLPITITHLKDADLVYNKLLGSELFKVPTGGKKRLEKWPELSSKKLEITGSAQENKKVPKEADADVVLSSAGWVAVNVATARRCKLEAWTPKGRGIFLRQVPIIKRGHIFRGEKIPRTPAFAVEMQEIIPNLE